MRLDNNSLKIRDPDIRFTFHLPAYSRCSIIISATFIRRYRANIEDESSKLDFSLPCMDMDITFWFCPDHASLACSCLYFLPIPVQPDINGLIVSILNLL